MREGAVFVTKVNTSRGGRGAGAEGRPSSARQPVRAPQAVELPPGVREVREVPAPPGVPDVR